MDERRKQHKPQRAPLEGQRLLDRPACPVCGGHLQEIRGKLQCQRCHTICETCCEGGRS